MEPQGSLEIEQVREVWNGVESGYTGKMILSKVSILNRKAV